MMKNKGLIASVVVIIAVVIGFFIYQTMNTPAKTAKKAEDKVQTVGILQFVSHPALDTITKGVKDALKEAGYKEGKNLKIVFQNGQADQSKLATMSQQLVDKKADVLVGVATPAAQSLANTTKDIPIVLGAVTDPVGAKLVASLDNPGGNVTGVSDQPPVASQIKLGKELLPDAKTVGMLYSSTEVNSKYQVNEASKTAESLGMAVKEYPVASTNEIAQTVQVMSQNVDFIYIPLDNTIANAMQAVVGEANKSKTPIITSVDTMVEQGGLATVGIDQYTLGKKTGQMVVQILKGADPSVTPVYTFKEGVTVLNEKQAEFLGIQIPDNLKKEAQIVGNK
ncbi:ABC transporter substrate-binding protein [Enterococcus cecorum]|uniref:ABC transporter substrate-binding protein n=2 Tax=Enterococcus cecorum TaxID=44008 RepID=S1RJT1_9ENTE|nr:ABC transporter substrate-binding protein [Enterococcus cecorum DSM 20682 = ATCC 43198]CAI3249721.1 ABC transporter substrate-binding protein [Enterococcus cecorum]ESK62321.1 ABC transporter substrate-binding protein [Enterococcus cecorum DSM 20682 = ATCC 43198]OJG32667.1 ABC transporter substrate-binding protein [Enterococcus cecorum DSM 20682 = ATCC 43198]CAI3253268.1 ABC transporter substrate-binding protein [Enterococcus cecorum]